MHDWDDTVAIDILRPVARPLKPYGKLLVDEHVIGLPNASPDGRFRNLAVMAVTDGRERTEDEFANLLAEAGFN